MALNKVTVPITAANGATIASFVATGNVDQYPEDEMIEHVVPTLTRTAAAASRTLCHGWTPSVCTHKVSTGSVRLSS